MTGPGDFTRSALARIGWRVGRRTIIVEGDQDEAYLKLASKLHYRERGVEILDDCFAVVSAGTGDDGGVSGVTRRFLFARQLAASDLHAGAPALRFFALFDGDHAGRTAMGSLKKLDPGVVEWRDVFLLRPMMPIAGGDAIRASIEACNREFGNVDCEIESFVGDELFALFCEDERIEPLSGRRRNYKDRDLNTAQKGRLKMFVEHHADFSSLEALVALALALRSYVGCPPPTLLSGA